MLWMIFFPTLLYWKYEFKKAGTQRRDFRELQKMDPTANR